MSKNPHNTRYPRTLLIGLGGSGKDILMNVRQDIINTNNSVPNSFLFIDNDSAISSIKKPFTDLSSIESLTIDGQNGQRLGLFVKDKLPSLKNRFPNTLLSPEYVEMLNRGSNTSRIRSLGALTVSLDINNIRKKISQKLDLLLGNKTQLDSWNDDFKIKNETINICIVGSLAGGTGSGFLVDIALLSRELINYMIGWDCTIIGYFTLPDESIDTVINENSKANAYAALMELQYIDDKEYSNISFDYDTGDSYELTVNHKLFDNIYLVSNKTSLGLLTMENMHRMLANSIYRNTCTPFGPLTNAEQMKLGIFTGLDLDEKSDKNRHFSTISEASLIFPAKRISDYCSNMSLSEVISGHILKDDDDDNKNIHENVLSFFNDTALEADQLINFLLKYQHDSTLSSKLIGIIPKVWLKEDKSEKIIAEVNSRLQYIDFEKCNSVPDMMSRNLSSLMGASSFNANSSTESTKFHQIILSWVNDNYDKHGIHYTLKCLDKLVVNYHTFVKASSLDLSNWEEIEREYIKNIEKSFADLSHHGVFNKITNKRNKITADLISNVNNLIDAKLLNLAQINVLPVLKQLLGASSLIQKKWSRVIQVLRDVKVHASSEALTIASSGTDSLKEDMPFSSEIDVTDPGYELQYYKNNFISAHDIYNAITSKESRFNNGKDFITWLLNASGKFNALEIVSLGMQETIQKECWIGIFDTSVLKYIVSTKEDVNKYIAEKIELLYDLSVPLWETGSHMIHTIQFPESTCLSVKFELDNSGEYVPPEIIVQHLHTDDPCFVQDSKQPYIITYSRLIHGARAYFLASTPEWENIYLATRMHTAGKYMLHVHSAFNNLPLLPPSGDISILTFAKAMALGIIVKRDEWFYFGLLKEHDNTTNTDSILIAYSSDLPTIQKLQSLPEKCGKLSFGVSKELPPERAKLATKRFACLEALRHHEDWINSINQVVEEYYWQIGSVFTKQLDNYIENFLVTATVEAVGSENELLNSELQALGEWCANNV